MNLLDELAARWSLLLVAAAMTVLIVFGPRMSRWVRRREWVRTARRHWRAHPSIEQASSERGPVPGQEEDT